MPKKPELRHANLRRDVNDLVRAEDGKVSEAKLWTNIGKGIAAYMLVYHTGYIVDRWDALAILLLILVAPDMVKKLLTLKYGGANGAQQKPKG